MSLNIFMTSDGPKKKLALKNECQLKPVTALGFKPKTFSSVVRCSIQLSYAAIIVSLDNFNKKIIFGMQR
jgi:hypothetical protein